MNIKVNLVVKDVLIVIYLYKAVIKVVCQFCFLPVSIRVRGGVGRGGGGLRRFKCYSMLV